MRLSTLIPYAAAILLAGLMAIGVAIFSVDTIERTTHSAIDFALEEEGMGWTQVSVDGLQVHLTGTAPDEASRFRAIAVAGRIVDSARVLDKMVVADPKGLVPPGFKIEILRNDDGISLFGLIPANTDRAALLKRAERAAGALPVTDLMDAADYPIPETWDTALDFGLQSLELLPRSKISVTPETVDIIALSDSAEQKRSFERQLASARPGAIAGQTHISAPRPVIAPFTLRFVKDEDGTRFDACSASSEQNREIILSAARDAGLDGKADCRIGLGVPSPNWPKAAAQAIAAIDTLGGGTVTFSNNDVTLVAPEGTDSALFDRVVGELEAALPDVFALNAVLPEPVNIDGTDSADGTPEFIVTRSPEGQVQLRGRVQDDRTRVAAESVARARFGVEGVYGAMRVDEELPVGWSARVLASIEAMSFLHNGSVIAQPDFVQVRGVTGDPEAKAEISRILAEQLGEGENFEIEVSYQKKLDPAEHIPTPEECVASINAILAVQKINFEPGSADIQDDARDVLDQIAAELTECEGVAMEIGGHTDSQGRPEMNMNLSQTRANAVLNGLLARRVLTSALTAKGYGETVPIADNGTEEGREQNRRIEFKLIVPDEAASDVADAPADQTEAAENTNGDEGTNE